MSVLIRSGVLADTDVLADLTRCSFDTALHPYLTAAQAGAAHIMALPLLHPQLYSGHDLLVATIEERLVGFADFRRPSEDESFLSYLCVAEDARGRGIASNLLDAYLLRTKAKRLSLDVFTSNMAANALYDRLGFSKGPRSMWLARPLPRAAETAEGIQSFASQEATYLRYGFSMFHTDGTSFPSANFGRIGPTVLKCGLPDAFDDDRILARVRASFPERTEAFTIVPEEHVASVPHTVVVRSQRRTLDLQHTTEDNRRPAHGA